MTPGHFRDVSSPGQLSESGKMFELLGSVRAQKSVSLQLGGPHACTAARDASRML